MPGDIILFCTINQDHIIYSSRNIQSDRMFCHFGPCFALSPLGNLENQNFEDLKKTPGDIIIFHMCTINDNHMMYGY